jgi:hypothetical protein
MSGAVRIVLLDRSPRRDYAVSFDAEAFVVEGVSLLPDRRVALRDVYGIERSGAWLWVGAGFVPVVLGGGDAPAERLARLEAELRARIGALPGGGGRLARIDARRGPAPGRPWLSGALALGLGAAAALSGALGLRFATDLLLLLAAGVIAEPVLGAVRLAASGAAALALTRLLAAGVPALALVPLSLALGWLALIALARLRREPWLGVRARSALEGGMLIAPLALVQALADGVAPGAQLAAALAAALLAPLLLRRWPEGMPPH